MVILKIYHNNWARTLVELIAEENLIILAILKKCAIRLIKHVFSLPCLPGFSRVNAEICPFMHSTVDKWTLHSLRRHGFVKQK